MTRDEIQQRVIDILLEHGPDGHIDGHEELTDFIVSLIDNGTLRPTEGEPECEESPTV